MEAGRRSDIFHNVTQYIGVRLCKIGDSTVACDLYVNTPLQVVDCVFVGEKSGCIKKPPWKGREKLPHSSSFQC